MEHRAAHVVSEQVDGKFAMPSGRGIGGMVSAIAAERTKTQRKHRCAHGPLAAGRVAAFMQIAGSVRRGDAWIVAS